MTVVARNRADDGSLVYSAQDESGQWDLYRVLPFGDSIVRLTDDPAVERHPAVDPRDGNGPVVFTRYERSGPDEETVRDGPADLYAIPRVDQYPLVHGDSVVFVRGRGTGDEDGLMELVLLDRSTGREEQLTRNGWNDYIPFLSADGTHLCWQSEEFGHYEGNIQIMDLRTREIRVLVDDPGREGGCFWTPDGQAVVYRAWGRGTPDVRIAPLDRDTTIALTRLDGVDSPFPSFIRVPPFAALAEAGQ